jgi:hypothetical protein
VIVMVAIGEGAKLRVVQQIGSMGTNLLVVSAAPAQRVAARPRQVPVYTLLTTADAAAVEQESTLAVAAAPAVNRSMVVRWEGVNTTIPYRRPPKDSASEHLGRVRPHLR